MSNAIVPGSLSDVARQENQSLATSFLTADAIVIVDTSGSMNARDADAAPKTVASWDEGIRHHTSGRTRYEAACDELTTLQAQLPGKIAVVAFSDGAEFCWSGRPPYFGGGTNLAGALRFVQPADGTGMRLIVISDGYPDDADAALQAARGFTSRIDTIYIGQPGSAGERFLARLAAASGGQHSLNTVPQLAQRIVGLLDTGRAAA